jgi:hypothetical protein
MSVSTVVHVLASLYLHTRMRLRSLPIFGYTQLFAGMSATCFSSPRQAPSPIHVRTVPLGHIRITLDHPSALAHLRRQRRRHRSFCFPPALVPLSARFTDIRAEPVTAIGSIVPMYVQASFTDICAVGTPICPGGLLPVCRFTPGVDIRVHSCCFRLWHRLQPQSIPLQHPAVFQQRQQVCFFFGGGSRPCQAGEARSPEGTRELSRNQGSKLSDDTIVPQGDVVADMTQSEDKLILIPGNAATTAAGYWGAILDGTGHGEGIRGGDDCETPGTWRPSQ